MGEKLNTSKWLPEHVVYVNPGSEAGRSTPVAVGVPLPMLYCQLSVAYSKSTGTHLSAVEISVILRGL